MPTLSEYVSLARVGETEIEVKKSRFIGLAAPVTDEEAAKSLLASVRARHREATHNTYAYRVGLGTMVERASDDGEPAGTAGRPLLEILTRRDLRNAMVIVTRYFGGTLLGAGGLLRAYNQAGAAAVEIAGLGRYTQRTLVAIGIDYPAWAKLEHELGRRGLEITGVEYAANVTVRVLVAPDAVATLTAVARDLTAGAATIREEGSRYVVKSE